MTDKRTSHRFTTNSRPMDYRKLTPPKASGWRMVFEFGGIVLVVAVAVAAIGFVL